MRYIYLRDYYLHLVEFMWSVQIVGQVFILSVVQI